MQAGDKEEMDQDGGEVVVLDRLSGGYADEFLFPVHKRI